ncbi:P27 family phage terminase small subunit [Microvirga antarctica]|uniref:P27 family phage terminase small subunit n=1 Tax=Microvirga antarctica TaxID=2819233 RepID=UPI001FE2D458|nr:P27 family phage terminase small subunit [Microvirga antarctica]
MGKRGPRPKLAAIEKIEGNPGKRVIIETGIVAEGDVFISSHLHEDAQACIEIIKSSMPPKTYAKVDSFALAAFATAWAIHKRAAHEMSNPDFEWLVVNGAGSLAKNPWFEYLRGAAKDMMSLGDRLGLDPKARAGLKLPEQKPKSKFDGLIGQSGSSRSLNA